MVERDLVGREVPVLGAGDMTRRGEEGDRDTGIDEAGAISSGVTIMP